MNSLSLNSLLGKIDYRISSHAFSRPQEQVRLLISKLRLLVKKIHRTLLDIGGGVEAQYKPMLAPLARKYINLEIKKGRDVDVVGSVYKMPFPPSSVDIATLFMVLEHLARPLDALRECRRVVKKGGYVAITTVQYWHTHNHPSDYFRYTKAGLEYILKEAGFKVVDIWSIGGPFLVIFHSIELNLPGALRTIFSIFFYRLFDWFDWVVFQHEDKRRESDSVGWSVIARKV